VAAISLSAQETAPTGLFFKPDGTKMYVIGTTSDRVFEYTLSTPWRVNTASNVGTSVATSSGGSSESAPTALFFRPDGSSYYIIGTGADRVKRYDMTTPWQVNTAAYYSQSAAITSIETTPSGLSFHPAGLKMFVVGQTNDFIREYDLATAWDPTTITLVANSSALLGTAPQGMFWKPDGTSVYIVDSTLDVISEYQVVAPFVTGNAVARRANVVASTGTTNTTANVVSFAPLGSISESSTVYVNQTILQSNIWEQFGTTLQNSTTVGAQFIRSEPSYTP
jgi:sugar lactone lactonase YvrE